MGDRSKARWTVGRRYWGCCHQHQMLTIGSGSSKKALVQAHVDPHGHELLLLRLESSCVHLCAARIEDLVDIILSMGGPAARPLALCF